MLLLMARALPRQMAARTAAVWQVLVQAGIWPNLITSQSVERPPHDANGFINISWIERVKNLCADSTCEFEFNANQRAVRPCGVTQLSRSREQQAQNLQRPLPFLVRR